MRKIPFISIALHHSFMMLASADLSGLVFSFVVLISEFSKVERCCWINFY